MPRSTSQVYPELGRDEFARFARKAGVALTGAECEVAISMLDADVDGLVSQQELLDWWALDL